MPWTGRGRHSSKRQCEARGRNGFLTPVQCNICGEERWSLRSEGHGDLTFGFESHRRRAVRVHVSDGTDLPGHWPQVYCVHSSPENAAVLPPFIS